MNSFELMNGLGLENIKNFDSAIGEASADFGSMPHEGDRTNVVSGVFRLVYLLDLACAPRPDIERSLQSDSNAVGVAPVDQIQVKVIAETRSV